MKTIIDNAKISHSFKKSDIINLLTTNDYNEYLYKTADEIRQDHVGNVIYLRALIEFSNICKNNCFYCGIRAENKFVKRYCLSEEEIIKTAKKACHFSFKTIVLQSGEADIFDDKTMCKIISEIKQNNVTLTLSIGEKTFEQYKMYKKAGADRFLLRIETTDKNLYEKMHPKMDFENRIKCLYNLKKLGYETGTGCLVGMPNQSLESLADDILFFKELNADMIGLGPFIATKNTPLEKENDGSFELARKIIAIVRILMPNINIPATTAMETLKENGRILALTSGANVVMPNFTSQIIKNDYSIYDNKSGISMHNFDKLKEEILSINRITDIENF